MAVFISIDIKRSKAFVLGSVKLYFKDAPTDNSPVDSCLYTEDAKNDRITAFLSPSAAEDAGGGHSLAHFVASIPSKASSVCVVEFLDPSNVSVDSPIE